MQPLHRSWCSPATLVLGLYRLRLPLGIQTERLVIKTLGQNALLSFTLLSTQISVLVSLMSWNGLIISVPTATLTCSKSVHMTKTAPLGDKPRDHLGYLLAPCLLTWRHNSYMTLQPKKRVGEQCNAGKLSPKDPTVLSGVWRWMPILKASTSSFKDCDNSLPRVSSISRDVDGFSYSNLI